MDGTESKKDSKIRDDPPPPPYTDIVWTDMTLALAQILLGNLMLIGGTLSISYYCELCYVSAGIWTGFVVLCTGVLGVIEASRKDYWSLTRGYAIMLFCTLLLSLVLLGIEIAGSVIDGERCDNPLRNSTTTVPPPTESPHYWTSHGYPWTSRPIPSDDCVIECVYIHASLDAFGLLDLIAAAVSIYYAYEYMKRMVASPPPYKAMVVEPIPYKQAI